jgi:phosphoglycerate kinase
MANTFLSARGLDVGKSLCEHDLVATAREIEAKAKAAGCEIMLPIDALAAKEFKSHPGYRVADVSDIAADEMILDAGPKSIEAVIARLQTMKTLVWNGASPEHEKVSDTWLDIANYGIIGLLCHRQEWK